MQKRAVDLFKRNVLSGGTKKLIDIFREAGYSEETANQQSNIMAGLMPHLADFLAEMEDHRAKVLERMKSKVLTADYGDLVRGLDVLTKNIQLLGGKPTANLTLTDERRAELEALTSEQ